MQEEETTTAGETKRELIGPTEPPAPQVTKVNVVFLSEPPIEAVEETPAVDLKEAIAERIRTDCRELRILTSEDTLIGLAPGDKRTRRSAPLWRRWLRTPNMRTSKP